MLIPLAIINHFKPTRELPGMKQLHELYPLGHRAQGFHACRATRAFFAWRNFFLRADHALKLMHPSCGWRPMRRRALEEAERWMLERIGEGSDGLAAVFPAMLNSLIALRALGYSPSTRSTKKRRRILPGFLWMIRKIFAFSPAFRRSGTRRSTSSRWPNRVCRRNIPALKKAANWLVEKEVRIRGDWTVNNPHPEASGWAFEYNNVYYPDTDDTAMVLMALAPGAAGRSAGARRAYSRALSPGN